MKHTILHNTVNTNRQFQNCIKINTWKKEVFDYDVQTIKRILHEPQDRNFRPVHTSKMQSVCGGGRGGVKSSR